MPFPIAAAAIMGGTSLLGGLLGGKGAKKAANAQVQAGREALALEERMFNQTRSDFAPWREAGARGLASLEAMLEPGYEHRASPGYAFRFNEGQRAVESGAAARGGLMSGKTLKDLARFGEGLAASDFETDWARKAGLAGIGERSTSSLAQLANASTGRRSDLTTGIGNARASGYVGQANAFQSGLSNLAMLYAMGGFGGGKPAYGGR